MSLIQGVEEHHYVSLALKACKLCTIQPCKQVLVCRDNSVHLHALVVAG